jgi:hypothetical protein
MMVMIAFEDPDYIVIVNLLHTHARSLIKKKFPCLPLFDTRFVQVVAGVVGVIKIVCVCV